MRVRFIIRGRWCSGVMEQTTVFVYVGIATAIVLNFRMTMGIFVDVAIFDTWEFYAPR